MQESSTIDYGYPYGPYYPYQWPYPITYPTTYVTTTTEGDMYYILHTDDEYHVCRRHPYAIISKEPLTHEDAVVLCERLNGYA